MAILLCMLQINVALGILYIGLQPARYRNRIYKNIVVECIGNADTLRQLGGSTKHKDGYNSKVAGDTNLSNCHHTVAMWVGELPEAYRKDLPSDMPTNINRHDSGTLEVPPWDYRWFKSNFDGNVIIFMCSIIPIIYLWLLLPLQDLCWWIISGYVLFFIGQCLIIFNIWFGNRIATNYSEKFATALEKVSIAIDESKIEDATSLRRSGQPGPPPIPPAS